MWGYSVTWVQNDPKLVTHSTLSVYMISFDFLTDEIECSISDSCNDNTECNDVDGAYQCTCVTGYLRDGNTCFGKYLWDLH